MWTHKFDNTYKKSGRGGGGVEEWIFLELWYEWSPMSSAQTNFTCASFLKVYLYHDLYPKILFDMWKGHSSTNIQLKYSSSNEIIHFKAKDLRGDYQNSAKQ